jgi:HlyD family secretion protein
MSRKKGIVGGVVIAALALLAWGLTSRGRTDAESFRFVEIERGDVVWVVSSSGTLRATTTVQVGTQVSGQIAEIHADFNDRVKKGQLVARIDPTLLHQEVRSAEAALDRSRAELELRRVEAARAEKLFADDLTSESAAELARSNLQVAQASSKSAEVNLERARRNLQYTEIRAPIDGVVVERNVDVGQTVAASLSAPQLFLIAEDLSQLQILASVDESDIGMIHDGQKVRFDVQAYPDETFPGVVRQVRLQSTVLENVVNYTAVVAVENRDGRLLPGMTATVEFVIERAPDVLKVPNQALRFRPTEEMRAKLGDRVEARDGDRAPGRRAEVRRGARGDSAGADSAGGGLGAAREGAGERVVLWRVDGRGNPVPVPVRAGITDGQFTVVEGPELEEGMQVIAATTSGSAGAGSTNPFQAQGPPRGGPGGFTRP